MNVDHDQDPYYHDGPPSWRLAVAATLLALILLLMAVGSIRADRTGRPIQRGPSTKAVVEEVWETGGAGEPARTHLRVRFNAGAARVRTEIDVSGHDLGYATGRTLDIRYSPELPSNAELPRNAPIDWGVTLPFVLLALVPGAIAGWLWRRYFAMRADDRWARAQLSGGAP